MRRQRFRATMATEPGRFRGLHGALLASQAVGDDEQTRQYSRQLVELCERAPRTGRPELQHARELL